jgi:maleate cis-trans isomerase
MHKKYGADVVVELHELRMSTRKVTDEELVEMLDQYKVMEGA